MGDHIFISHAVKEKNIAEIIRETLESSGWRCWIAPRDILPGDDWGEAIIDAINRSGMMILVYSESAGRSVQIKREVERASSKGVIIIPFRVEDVPISKSLEYYLATAYWLDAVTSPIEPHLEFLRDLVRRSGGTSEASGMTGFIGGCPKCGASIQPWEEKCHKCDYVRELSASAKEVFAKRRVPRKRSRFWPSSRLGKISLTVAALVLLCAASYLGFRVWRGAPTGSFDQHLNQGQGHLSRGEFDPGIAELTKAIEGSPSNWLGYRWRGDAYLRQGNYRGIPGNYRLAADDLARAVKLNPKDEVAYVLLGQAHIRLRAYDEALVNFDAAIKIEPNSYASLKGRAYAFFELKRYDRAINDLHKAEQISSQDPEILSQRGDVFMEMRNYEKAVDDFSAAIRLNSTNPYFYRRRGAANSGLGKSKEAEADDREAQRLAVAPR